MEYITVRQAAENWGVSTRRVQQMCETGRINGVARFSNLWMIPKDTEKPRDTRGDWHKKERLRPDET